jgi:hypothetical protein
MATAEVDEREIGRARLRGAVAIFAGEDYLHVRPLGDGRAVYLLPMFGGNLRLAIGAHGASWFDDGWCYQAEQNDLAWKAALGWDGEGEPEGWYRHPDTGRRRPGGDASKEVRYW